MTVAASQPLSAARYLGYGAGDAANNLTFSMASAFLLIYYTDVAGISAATAGTLFLVVRVWGGFTDLLAGRIVDQTSTRWGRFRPYLLFGSVPLLVLTVALFSVPGGWSDDAKVVYAYVTYALFSLAYSFVNIPYGSLSAAMTQDPEERARLSTSRMVWTSLTILVIAVIVSPQIERATDLQRSLTTTTALFAVVGFGLYVWCFSTARETVRPQREKTSIRAAANMLRHNRPLVLLCLSCLWILGGMFSLSTVAVYYARDVLDNAELYIVMMVVQTVATIVAAVLVPTAVRALGKRAAFVVAGCVASVGALGVAVAPGATPAVALACFGVLALGLGVANTLIFALQADTVEYGEWKAGIRGEASVYSVLSFTRKAGQGVGGAAAAYTIGVGGYVTGAAVQSGGAEAAIRVAAGVIPAITILVGALIMLAYPLTEERFRGIVETLAQGRAGGAHAG